MKRALILGALAALLLAATAFAATKTYKGKIKGDQKSSVALTLKQKDGKASVKSFVAKDFLISCGSSEARLESATITGLVPVNDKGKFRVTGSNGGQELKVAGKVLGNNHAKGTVHYSGPTVVDGENRNCDSGKLDWSASR
jgi:hypothetical protein